MIHGNFGKWWACFLCEGEEKRGHLNTNLCFSFVSTARIRGHDIYTQVQQNSRRAGAEPKNLVPDFICQAKHAESLEPPVGSGQFQYVIALSPSKYVTFWVFSTC